ncbi:hypothetical protein ACOSQ3_024355 [Xanthoceras sorbifolium]
MELQFQDPWIPRPSSFKPVSPPHSNYVLVKSFLDLENHVWDVGKLEGVFLDIDREAILSIPLSIVRRPDAWSYDLIGLGGVIRNSDEGLVVAKQLGLPVALAEVDASSLVDGVNLLKPYLSVAELVISDIQTLCSEVGIQKCQAVAKSSNSLAHNLASLAISSSRDFLWQDICPSVMLSLCG